MTSMQSIFLRAFHHPDGLPSARTGSMPRDFPSATPVGITALGLRGYLSIPIPQHYVHRAFATPAKQTTVTHRCDVDFGTYLTTNG